MHVAGASIVSHTQLLLLVPPGIFSTPSTRKNQDDLCVYSLSKQHHNYIVQKSTTPNANYSDIFFARRAHQLLIACKTTPSVYGYEVRFETVLPLLPSRKTRCCCPTILFVLISCLPGNTIYIFFFEFLFLINISGLGLLSNACLF